MGAGGGGAMAPPKFDGIEKRTEAKRDNLVLLHPPSPMIFGPSVVPESASFSHLRFP